jgi:Transcriptional regulator, AbiEi antitoxin
MSNFLSTADARIASIAGRQHGVVTTAQLAKAGIDKFGLRRRVLAGRLHRLHRGVYAVGHRGLSWRGRWLAAMLAAGDGAALSHTSAAALWGFLRPVQGPIHVSVPAAVRRTPRPGLQIHRSRALTPSHITRRHGIAVTIPARTIEDIRPSIEPYLFRQLGLPPGLGRLRGRSRPRPRPSRPRDRHPPLHRRPARSRTGGGRRRPAGGAPPRLVELRRWPTRPSSS